ncbi:MAG: helix-turn-helix domain-containing protein [Clostridia bacterium]|nr:helix-turn-helix domain-containing protein [Clostridia bacterium]
MNNISFFRKQRGWSQSQFAEKIKVARSTISMWETNASEPSFEQIITMSRIFEISPEELMGQETNLRKVNKIPVFDSLDKVSSALEYIETTQTYGSDIFGYIVNDESMSPRIFRNDIVLISKQTNAQNGDICLLKIGNDEIIRKIKKVEDGIMLIPNNLNSETLYFSKKQIKQLPLRIIGKVVELRSSNIK